MSNLLTFSLIVSGIHLSAPLLLAAMGGLLSERSGVVNIALEGQMLFGAFAAVLAQWWWHNRMLSLIAALGVGAFLGLVHAWMSVSLRANQIIAATAANLLGVGLTAALIAPVWGKPGASPTVSTIRAMHIPLLDRLPAVGLLFRDLTIVDWFALALAPMLWVVLYRTPFGLRLRSCGENPQSAASVGINVIRVRYQAVILSAMLAGLGGAYLSLVQVGVFQRGMTQGRGFLALAALIFGKWRPIGVFGACMLFGLADAFQFRAQTAGINLPHELLLALPYVVALIALATFVGRAAAPAAIGKPYVKE